MSASIGKHWRLRSKKGTELFFIAVICYSDDAVTEQVADSFALRPSWMSGAILRNREGLFVATFFSRIVILSRAATSQSKQQSHFTTETQSTQCSEYFLCK